MAFKEITDLNADTTISLGGVNKKTGKANPTKVEGYYLGLRTVEDRKAKSGVSYIYILQTPKGNLGVWGKTDLNTKMRSAIPGQMVRITQTTKVATPNGEMYKFKVEADPENTIEVSGHPPVQAVHAEATGGIMGDGNEEDSNTYSFPAEDNEEEEEIDADSYSQRYTASSSAASKAKVQEILNRGKQGNK